MSTSSETTVQFPLKVTLSAMSDRTRALIEYYIARSKNRYFAIAGSNDSPDVIIVDHDHPGTAKRLAASSWQANIPLVILAVGDRQVDDAIMVRKPLDSAGLEKAAKSALQQLNEHSNPSSKAKRDDNDPEANHGSSNLPKLTQKASSEAPTSASSVEITGAAFFSDNAPSAATPPYFRTDDTTRKASANLPIQTRLTRYQAKIEQLCGASRSLEQLSDPDDTEHRFDSSHCLARHIASLLTTPKPDFKAAHFSLPDADIYLLPTLGKVYTSISMENKRNVDRLFRSDANTEIKATMGRQATANNLINRLNQMPHYGFNVQSFCWLGALFFAQGRWPQGLDIDTVWKLRHWPNLTRLELIPNCLEIAAAWSEKPAKLSQIIERVGCEPRHATSFFSAAYTVGVLYKDDEYGH